MDALAAAMHDAIDNGEWLKLIQLAHEAALAEGNADATAWLADARGDMVPSFDITFQTALDAITQIPGSWEGAQGWLDKAAHGLAYDVGQQVSDAIAAGASYDDLLQVVQGGYSGSDSGASVIVNDMLASGSNQGSLDLYSSEGLSQADILVSPGACDICAGYEDQNPWDLADAQNTIPAHVNCRCAWSPVVS